MPQLVDHLAELTGYRDRDMLDVTLVGVLRDLLQPRSVAVYRCVGEAGRQRWLTRARQSEHEPVASADPLWVDLSALPALDDHPLRAECLRQGAMRTSRDGCTTVLPLFNDREVVGVVELTTADPIAEEVKRLLDGVLRVVRNFLSLLEYSERDTLTGLLNRKTFDDSFLRSTARATAAPADTAAERRQTAGLCVWLGVIDIDHFKAVNDTFGHLIGDEVLLLLSRLMRSCFRWHDQLYRFGGEEFVVLLRAPTPDDAASAFERLRQAVQSYAFPQVGRLTVSVGFTEVLDGDTPAAAFERADRSVYHAKQNGRNQVACFEDLVAAGVFVDAPRASEVELF